MKTTTLAINIDYDPSATDPESLAQVMDILLDTALSSPNALNDCGEVFRNNFSVQEKKSGQVLTDEEVEDLANWLEKNHDDELALGWDRMVTLIEYWSRTKASQKKDR